MCTPQRLRPLTHTRASDNGCRQEDLNRPEIDFARETPLLPWAVQVLKDWQRAQRGATTVLPTGDAWVFPAPKRPGTPVSRHTLIHWFAALVTQGKVTPRPGLGYHSLRRKLATELKGESLKDTAYLGGWKSIRTLTEVYQAPDVATQRAVLERRQALTAGGLTART